MIFPEDITRKFELQRKVTPLQKFNFILMGTLLSGVYVYFTAAPFVEALGIPAWVLAVLEVFIVVGILIVMWRFFWFKEPERAMEAEQNIQDSIAKFYKLRNLDSVGRIKVGGRDLPVYEFDNGNPVMYIRFLIGENNETRVKRTQEALKKVFAILGEANLPFKMVIGREKFKDSPESKDFIDSLKKIEDQDTAYGMRMIYDQVLAISSDLSNVDVITMVVHCTSTRQKYKLEMVISSISAVLKETQTNFRKVSFLYKKPVLDALKSYYNLEAIDETLMSLTNSKKNQLLGINTVFVYCVSSKEGSVEISDRKMDKWVQSSRKII